MPEQSITRLVDGVETPAVWTSPQAARAALLLIPGSFNIDEDGNMAPAFPGQPPLRSNTYRDLAEQLGERGIAVLRYSKGGPGTRCVIHDAALAAGRYREFGQRVVVAAAFWEEMERQAPGVPRFAAGHSEGAVVATQLARRQPEMRGLVLLSGPSLPLLQMLLWQRYLQDPDRDEDAYAAVEAWAREYAAGSNLAGCDFQHNRYAGMFAFYLDPKNTPYLRSLEQVDPASELAQVTLPVLLVQGGQDSSVMAENADRLLAAQPRATPARLAGLQHFYKRVPAGMTLEAAFGLEGETDPGVAQAVAAWICART